MYDVSIICLYRGARSDVWNNCMLKQYLLILFRISRSAGFENFLAKKWTAEKRFGLEGVEMLIPCMKQVIDRYRKFYQATVQSVLYKVPYFVPPLRGLASRFRGFCTGSMVVRYARITRYRINCLEQLY
jgi:hypothetical protein